jgi:hypothetical protein
MKKLIPALLVLTIFLAPASAFSLELSILPGMKKFSQREMGAGFLMIAAPRLHKDIFLKMVGDTNFEDYFHALVLFKNDFKVSSGASVFPQIGMGFDFWDDDTMIFRIGGGTKARIYQEIFLTLESNYSYFPQASRKSSIDLFAGLLFSF